MYKVAAPAPTTVPTGSAPNNKGVEGDGQTSRRYISMDVGRSQAGCHVRGGFIHSGWFHASSIPSQLIHNNNPTSRAHGTTRTTTTTTTIIIIIHSLHYRTLPTSS